jgi:hypothetical protein
MRFSVLAVELSSHHSAPLRERLHDIAQFAARENVSCILLSIEGSSDSTTDSTTGSPEDLAQAVAGELSRIGLRYESVTSDSAFRGGGSAVLSQLALLATIAPTDTADPSSGSVSAARLAVAPRSVIDAYVVGPSESEEREETFETVISLIEQTENMLERRQAEKPRRRGPIRRGPKVSGEPVQTRFVCVSGPSSRVVGERGKELAEAKLTNVTEHLSSAPAVLVRPAIKPVASTTVTLSLGNNESDQASFVAFDL